MLQWLILIWVTPEHPTGQPMTTQANSAKTMRFGPHPPLPLLTVLRLRAPHHRRRQLPRFDLGLSSGHDRNSQATATHPALTSARPLSTRS
jgi:hypothetical protein